MPDQQTKRWDGPPLSAWAPWSPTEVAEQLTNVGVPWCVVGGWAIDLFLDRQTRTHDDIEIAIVRADFQAVRAHLGRWHFYSVGNGEVASLANGAQPSAIHHQNWLLEPTTQRWRMDVMLEPGDHDTWIYRRNETIRAPRAQMIGVSSAGIPFLKPQAGLLYKAKSPRAKDEQDFSNCLPQLDPDARAWLRAALTTTQPDHAWLTQLR